VKTSFVVQALFIFTLANYGVPGSLQQVWVSLVGLLQQRLESAIEDAPESFSWLRRICLRHNNVKLEIVSGLNTLQQCATASHAWHVSLSWPSRHCG